MNKWSWIDRPFNFDFPPEKFPDILERFRGTPARLEERLATLSPELVTRRDGSGWSIQENVGHLLDLESLPRHRIDEILAGKTELCAADMTNRRTTEANHNEADLKDLLRKFRLERGRLIDKLQQLDGADWARTALHPRLQKPMRIVDIAFFHSEHDDYHLGRIGELIRTLNR